mgnify:CR=1 FL=1
MFYFPERQGLNRRLAYGDYIRGSRFFRRDLDNGIYIRGYSNMINNRDKNNKGITLLSLRRNSKIYIKEEESNIDCSICLEEKGIIIRELTCGHPFPINCIEKWICINNSCSNGRKPLL